MIPPDTGLTEPISLMDLIHDSVIGSRVTNGLRFTTLGLALHPNRSEEGWRPHIGVWMSEVD